MKLVLVHLGKKCFLNYSEPVTQVYCRNLAVACQFDTEVRYQKLCSACRLGCYQITGRLCLDNTGCLGPPSRVCCMVLVC